MSQSSKRARQILDLTVDLLKIAAAVIKAEGKFVTALISGTYLRNAIESHCGRTETQPVSAED